MKESEQVTKPSTAFGEQETGKDTDWVRLQSTDGFSYLVRRKLAKTSGTIRTMLDPAGGYAEAQNLICEIKERCVLIRQEKITLKTCVFLLIRGIIVEKLVEYMSFKSHYESVGPKEDIPVRDFLERIPPEIVLELYSTSSMVVHNELRYLHSGF